MPPDPLTPYHRQAPFLRTPCSTPPPTGLFGVPQRTAYCAAKAALNRFFEALRYEERCHNITVTTVCPGFVRTQVSYNALGPDGKPTQQTDTDIAGGMTAERYWAMCCFVKGPRVWGWGWIRLIVGGETAKAGFGWSWGRTVRCARAVRKVGCSPPPGVR